MTKTKTTVACSATKASGKTAEGVARPKAKGAAIKRPVKHPVKTVVEPAAPLAPAAAPTPILPPARETKASLLRSRLAEPGGVSLATLMLTMGWQAHTIRAALSGLRKEGLTITRRREGDDTIYASMGSVGVGSDDEPNDDDVCPAGPPAKFETAAVEPDPVAEIGAPTASEVRA